MVKQPLKSDIHSICLFCASMVTQFLGIVCLEDMLFICIAVNIEPNLSHAKPAPEKNFNSGDDATGLGLCCALVDEQFPGVPFSYPMRGGGSCRSAAGAGEGGGICLSKCITYV